MFLKVSQYSQESFLVSYRLKKRLKKEKCQRAASVTLPYDFIKKTLHHECFPKCVRNFFWDSNFTKHIWATAYKEIYLFTKPNNYCSGRAAGQLSKLSRRNTVTSFKTLVKSHKGLKNKVFARKFFRKKII